MVVSPDGKRESVEEHFPSSPHFAETLLVRKNSAQSGLQHIQEKIKGHERIVASAREAHKQAENNLHKYFHDEIFPKLKQETEMQLVPGDVECAKLPWPSCGYVGVVIPV